jgi:hypothetical protein
VSNRTAFPIFKLLLATAVIVFTSVAVHAAPTPSASTARATKAFRTTPNCSWDRPGHNPFMGDVVAAVDRYPDISPEARTRLKERMAKRQYDDIVVIKRDAITGKDRYDPAIRSMHFGESSVCNTVTRTGWSDTMEERGLVYCDGDECILVPTVCRNVSRISRLPTAVSPAALPPVAVDEPFVFPPPGAGPADTFSGMTPEGGEGGVGPLAAFDSPGAGPASSVTGFPGAPPIGFGPTLPNGGLNQPTASTPTTPDVPSIPTTPDTSIPPVTAVPEPGTWALMLTGLAGLIFWSRRRTSNA